MALAGGDGIDSTTVSFLVRVALKQKEEEKEKKGKEGSEFVKYREYWWLLLGAGCDSRHFQEAVVEEEGKDEEEAAQASGSSFSRLLLVFLHNTPWLHTTQGTSLAANVG